MTLRGDIAESFKTKGLTFVSLNESAANPEGSILVYADVSGKQMTKEIGIRLEELEDTIEALDAIDPEDIVNFLLQ